VSVDLRTFVARELRLHPRVAYQGYLRDEGAGAELAADLPPMPSFRTDYVGAIAIVDWDHRLPSEVLALRIYAYYSEDTLASGYEAFDDRLEIIGSQDRYPEFDVPDFDHLAADEAYEIEISPDGEIGRSRLTSAWRRDIAVADGDSAVGLTRRSEQFRDLQASFPDRPPNLGDLEAVSWTPPCESQLSVWTLDVWYLLQFDGRMGSGRSFLIDLDKKKVAAVRDFSVRAG
jgi:hypothetical protein